MIYFLPRSHGQRIRGVTTLGSLWLFYVKMVGRANSNDLEIPGGESFSKEKIVNVIPSSKVGVGHVSVSEGSSTAAEQLKPKAKQIEDVTGKFRYDRFGYFYGLFMCHWFQIICHSQMCNRVLIG